MEEQPVEYVDVYNAQRERIGAPIPREGAFMHEGEYVLYVLVVVEDAQGKMLITQRAMDKHWGAGWWEIPGGGVRAGEDTAQAAVREVSEEVGLDITGATPEVIYTYTNVDLEHGSNYMVDFYRVRLDFTREDVVLQQSEAIDAALVSWDDIVSLADQGIFLHFGRLQAALGR